LTVTAINSARAADTWTQWRGPQRDSRIEAKWPDSIGEESLKQMWRVELGPSYSGPVVSEKFVYTTATRDASDEVVYAYDRETGKLAWDASWKGAMKVPFFAKANGDWIRATPVLDGDRLYVGGMRDVLVCLDATTGKENWRVDFPKVYKASLPSFGNVSSPLIDGDAILVQSGGAVYKLNKLTGEMIWKTLSDGGGMSGGAFSSPVIAVLADKRQLLVQTRTTLAGVDIPTGDVLWSEKIKAFRGMNILTPTVVDNQIFTSAYGGKSLMFEITGESDKLRAEEKWVGKSEAYMSSPIAIDGYIYVHLRNQRFICLKAETGEIMWTTTPYGKYWSMVAAGDKILALDERGELLLIKANPEKFELLEQRTISKQQTWAHLAVAGNQVFIRELKALTVYRWK